MDELISEAVRNKDAEPSSTEAREESAEYYLALASESSGEIQQQYLIKAAQLLYQRGDIASAQSQLESIQPDDIEGARQVQIQLLAARIALANGNPMQSIELLPERDQLTLKQFLEASAIRSDANIAMGYFMEAVRTRVDIDPLFNTEQERMQNHEAIWTALSTMPDVIMKGEKSNNRTIQGWIELNRIMRNAQTDISWLQEDVLNWGTQYQDHPISNAFIDQLLDAYLSTYTSTKSIAVFLPMQGRYQSVADAIKSGFISAYYKDKTAGEKPAIRFYDTSDENMDFMQLYQKAVLEGANHIVGPLDKSTINRLAQMNELDIPVLTLNYAENPLTITDNLYQFGLLPEDEASQAAELAARQNKTKAAILVPDSDWGRRLEKAFRTRFEELGGKVHSTQFFDAKADDYGLPIRRLFNLQSSNARHRSMEKLLGTDLKFTPYRRQDIDMIFLAATHRSARGIMPAFKFHHAGDLPVYSTSHVYTGSIDKTADLDLNGLLFCDLPWTLVSDNELRKAFDNDWPEQHNFTRLFALGIDAYHVIRNLNYLTSHDYARFSGQTGNIYMDENQRLHRELLWAKFRNGKPRFINTTIAPKALPKSEADQS
jgi:outer membrane PBP1 activator LpoA protein